MGTSVYSGTSDKGYSKIGQASLQSQDSLENTLCKKRESLRATYHSLEVQTSPRSLLAHSLVVTPPHPPERTPHPALPLSSLPSSWGSGPPLWPRPEAAASLLAPPPTLSASCTAARDPRTPVSTKMEEEEEVGNLKPIPPWRFYECSIRGVSLCPCLCGGLHPHGALCPTPYSTCPAGGHTSPGRRGGTGPLGGWHSDSARGGES